jgi:uroporphyrinogen III methyltransferase / synthase
MARESRPLAGRRIVVTRAREQAGDLVRALERLGADVITAPTIRIEPLTDLLPLRAALADLSRYRWIVFTSRNTVDVVCDHMPAWGLEPASLSRAAIAAIGPATAAALARRGARPALVPERYVAEAVVAAMARVAELAGTRVLLPRALDARDALPDGLRAHGALVDVIPVYRTVPATGDGGALARDILAGRYDAITFTSSSTVRHFVHLVGRAAATSGRFAAAVIGPVTAATARELGVRVDVEAAEYTAPGLVAALERHFQSEGGRGKEAGAT